VTKNLTLTLGTRYEYSSPKLDTKGRRFPSISASNPWSFPMLQPGCYSQVTPERLEARIFPTAMTGLHASVFAWSPGTGGKTSIRGGIGFSTTF